MKMADFPLLSILIFFPLVGAILLVTLSQVAAKTLYWLAVAWAALSFGLSLVILGSFADGTRTGFYWGENLEWVKALGLNYQLGVDSISAWLVTLTTFVTLIAVLAAGNIQERPRFYWAWLLTLGGSVVGVFTSVNLLVFYVFWEVMLIPAYFMIGGWGTTPGKRVRAAIRFVLYTLLGSLLMLIAMLALIFTTIPANGIPSLDFISVRQAVANLPQDTQNWMFLAFAAAFVVKVPLVPFHSWQPDAYVEAPTPTTVMLAGIMSKTGAYGFLRFGVLLFPGPARDFAPWMCGLALASILYGALAALGARDLKLLLTYSSLSHLGFVLLGIFAINPQGVNGAVLQMVNHGITTPALFLAAGFVAARTGTGNLQKLGGLQSRWPRMAALFLILGLASLGLPGLNQFAGEFLILGGAFEASPIYAAIGVIGVVLAAWYMIRAFQLVWHGPEQPVVADSQAVTLPPTDMRPLEYVIFVPMVLLIILLGVAPIFVTGLLDATVTDWLAQAAKLAAGR